MISSSSRQLSYALNRVKTNWWFDIFQRRTELGSGSGQNKAVGVSLCAKLRGLDAEHLQVLTDLSILLLSPSMLIILLLDR